MPLGGGCSSPWLRYWFLRRRHNVYPVSLKQNRTFRLSESTQLSAGPGYMFRLSEAVGLSMQKIHHHVLRFITAKLLNACLTISMFSADVLGRPLLTAFNTDLFSIIVLRHWWIEERDGGFFTCLQKSCTFTESCYRTELFYFNYLSLLGLEHIYISYFLQQPKKSVCLQLLRTLLCFVFRSFRKSFFHVFARLLITL